jgi:F-type H+-transporting ATPase subunit epsilon
MNGAVFKLSIVTPSSIMVREVQSLRLTDETGAFGILKGHADFLTALPPSLGYYLDATGKEIFVAVDGGVFSIRGKDVTLTTKELFESEQPEELSAIMEHTIHKREKNEQSFSAMLKGIEKSFIEKTVALTRDRT